MSSSGKGPAFLSAPGLGWAGGRGRGEHHICGCVCVCVSLLLSKGAWEPSEVLPEGEAPPPGVQVRANAERKQSRDGESLNEKDKGFV